MDEQGLTHTGSYSVDVEPAHSSDHGSTAPVSRRRRPTGKSLRRGASWFLSVIVVGILLSAVGSQVVAYYFPDAMAARPGGRLASVQAGFDQAWYSDGWWLALRDDVDLETERARGNSDTDVRAWVMQQGGVDVGETHLKVVLRGESAVDVLITAARVDILVREDPWDTASVMKESAGANEVLAMYFDLDEELPLARHFDTESGEPGDAFFSDYYYTLAHREILVFEVVAATESCYCEWKLEFDVERGDRKETLVVDDGGNSFKTSAYPPQGFHRDWTWTWWDPPARFQEVDWEN